MDFVESYKGASTKGQETHTECTQRAFGFTNKANFPAADAQIDPEVLWLLSSMVKIRHTHTQNSPDSFFNQT